MQRIHYSGICILDAVFATPVLPVCSHPAVTLPGLAAVWWWRAAGGEVRGTGLTADLLRKRNGADFIPPNPSPKLIPKPCASRFRCHLEWTNSRNTPFGWNLFWQYERVQKDFNILEICKILKKNLNVTGQFDTISPWWMLQLPGAHMPVGCATAVIARAAAGWCFWWLQPHRF